jgi:hypothetical protein
MACVVEASQRVRIVHNSFHDNSGTGITVPESFHNLDLTLPANPTGT